MSDSDTLAALFALAQSQGRTKAVKALTTQLGAEALFVFVRDAQVRALVPARGFPSTYPGGSSWRSFLSHCEQPGVHEGELAYPDKRTVNRAFALVLDDGTAWIFIGRPRELDETLIGAMEALSALFVAEIEAMIAHGMARAALDAAAHASSVTEALEATRRDLQRAAERERDARHEAEVANRAKDEFLAMLGHELRNPLAPIVTAIKLIKLRGKGDSPEHATIERQMGHVVRLVDDLLDVSRITRGKVELNLTTIDLSSVVARSVEMASPLLESSHHRLTVSKPPGDLTLSADEGRLTQVLTNLLTNAARYTPPGGDIVLSLVPAEEEIEILVTDSGIGIEPDMLARVFDLFVQGKRGSDRAEGGLGLGLAIVRSLVTLHGGTVQAQSTGRNQGSTFRVRLPRLPAKSSGEAPSRAPAQVPSAQRQRVLIVDDNTDAAAMLAEFIEMHGHDVAVAHDGPTALRMVEAQEPDCAILDIGLPVMDGYQLARELRARKTARVLRLVALTGYGQPDDRLRSSAAGFDAHLVKPVDLDDLLREVANVSRSVSSEPGLA